MISHESVTAFLFSLFFSRTDGSQDADQVQPTCGFSALNIIIYNII